MTLEDNLEAISSKNNFPEIFRMIGKIIQLY